MPLKNKHDQYYGRREHGNTLVHFLVAIPRSHVSFGEGNSLSNVIGVLAEAYT